MGKRKHRDIEIRGVVYPTVQAAAVALGVSDRTVHMAIRNGTLHRCGTGLTGKERMAIRIRGKVYADAYEAAAEFGLTPQAIWRAVQDGREDRIGLPQRYVLTRATPFEIAGMAFPSQAAASRAIGRAPEYVSHVLKRGGARARESMMAKFMRLAASRDGQAVTELARERREGSVTIGALTFASQKEAARRLGFKPQHIRFALDGQSRRKLAEIEAAAQALAERQGVAA